MVSCHYKSIIAIPFTLNLSSASNFAYNYPFLRSVVSLSVVCHIRAPCLNRSTDSNGTLVGPVTHCVRSLTPHGRVNWGEGWTPSQNLHLPSYDSPGGSTDQRFRLLPNYFDHLFLVLSNRKRLFSGDIVLPRGKIIRTVVCYAKRHSCTQSWTVTCLGVLCTWSVFCAFVYFYFLIVLSVLSVSYQCIWMSGKILLQNDLSCFVRKAKI